MTKRIAVLDSLRGIASLQVLIHHCLIAIPLVYSIFYSFEKINHLDNPFFKFFFRIFIYSPFHFLWTGDEAVTLFFVLSGFVLSMAIDSYHFNFTGYVVKRFFRLYMPYLVTICLAVFLMNMIKKEGDHVVYLSNWFNTMWQKKISYADALNLIIMRGNFHNIVTSLWTLVIEFKISLIFPVFVLLLNKLSKTQSVVAVALYPVFYHVSVHLSVAKIFPEFAILLYLTFFLMGYLVYKFREDALIIFNKFSLPQFLLIFLLAIIIYTTYWWMGFSSESHKILLKVKFYLVGFSSMILIILCLTERAKAILVSKPLVFLGKISFSLYMIHPVVILCCAYLLPRNIPIYVLLVFIILISIPIAYFYFLAVENPFMKLGHLLAQKIKTPKTVKQ